MKNSKELFSELINLMHLADDSEEISAVGHVLLEDLFGITRSQILTNAPVEWDEEQQRKLEAAVVRINEGEPVQYVVGFSVFLNRKFFVDGSVLIPRPETEELVLEVLQFIKGNPDKEDWRILDIGTGSGCIPVSIAAALPQAEVMATDVSDKALVVARRNVLNQKVEVQLLNHDILRQQLPFRNLDVVISNPPYIPLGEKDSMLPNVLNYEPYLALFVKDKDPLLFYREIASKASGAMRRDGLIAFEVNPQYADDVSLLLTENGFINTEIKKDIMGKPRIVTARQS